jgi:hypothetical protein
LDVHLRKKIEKCYIWSIALYGGENWTLQKLIRSNCKVSECAAGEWWRRKVTPIISEMKKCYKESQGGGEYSTDNEKKG